MSIEQMARLVCVPIAMSIFLLAAQASAGLQIRETHFGYASLK